MSRAKNAQSKQTTAPSPSIFQSSPASVMVPRLMVIFSSAALLVIGLVMVFSASSISDYVEQGNAVLNALKQLVFAAVGIGFCIVCIICCREESLRNRLGFIYWGFCMLLILLTAVMGTTGLGAKRWLYIGSVSIQPSELAKIAFVIMGVQIVCERNEGLIDKQAFLRKLLIFILIPLAVIFFAQSDLGTTIICAVALLAVLWLGGANIRTMLALLGALVLLGIVATLLQGYRSDRMIFLNPWADPDNTGYQLIHSFKAFAAGGLTGLGLGNSYEKLLYLPEAETDFIFSIIGEEMGLIGTVFVVVLFMVFLYGGLSIARKASSDHGLILAGSLTTMLVFQAFLNIMCVIGLFPTTGKPLPFISSGGSSLISSLIIVGIILSVSFHSDDKRAAKQKRDNLRVVSSRQAPVRSSRGQLHMNYGREIQRQSTYGASRKFQVIRTESKAPSSPVGNVFSAYKSRAWYSSTKRS